ncbi:MAG: competence/damage-inducible protein A, partial [Lachnospiraceae bacterium]|nr:competence/damage-inducible protein A [Lachnospiraceae bacterium]
MVVELISVGTEILMGNIINTNAAYLSGRLADQGMSVYFQDVVGDNEERLTETLSLALSRSDIVILSGGLGPTPDDLTKEVAAKTAGVNLYMDEACKSAIGDYFNKIGRTPTDNNWKQALMPEGGVVLPNHNGTAPGCIIKTEDGKHIILLPGPPEELKPMFEE